LASKTAAPETNRIGFAHKVFMGRHFMGTRGTLWADVHKVFPFVLSFRIECNTIRAINGFIKNPKLKTFFYCIGPARLIF
jgi:hypothetical protein